MIRVSRETDFLPGDISGQELLALCERQARGEIHIFHLGVATVSRWRVNWRELRDTPDDARIARNLMAIAKRSRANVHKPAFGCWPSVFNTNRKERP